MKAFVIKNKNGEYIKEVGDDFYEAEPTRDISLALIYDENEMNIMKEAYPEYDYVEITIAEGDLEQENKQLKERISDYEKVLNGELFINFKLPMEHTKLKREVEELKEQLAIREKALELACDFMEEKCDWNCNSLVVYSTKKEIYDYFIEQAKESINGNKF